MKQVPKGGKLWLCLGSVGSDVEEQGRHVGRHSVANGCSCIWNKGIIRWETEKCGHIVITFTGHEDDGVHPSEKLMVSLSLESVAVWRCGTKKRTRT